MKTNWLIAITATIMVGTGILFLTVENETTMFTFYLGIGLFWGSLI